METTKTNKNVSTKTRNLVTSALLAAIICLVTGHILHIPTVNGGYAHIGDSIIYLSAAILPLPYAMVCSAIGAGLADLTSGAFIWVVPTLMIKPIIVLLFSNKSDKILTTRNIVAVEGLMFGNMAVAFAITAVGMIQPIGSFIVFIILGIVLDKINIKQFFDR